MGGITSSHKNDKRDDADNNGVASPIQSADPGLLGAHLTDSKDDSAIISGSDIKTIETPVISKGKSIFGGLIDPRSPTQEISRTPIAVEEQRARREAALARLADFKENSPLTSTPNGYFDSRPKAANSATPIRYTSVLKEGRHKQT